MRAPGSPAALTDVPDTRVCLTPEYDTPADRLTRVP